MLDGRRFSGTGRFLILAARRAIEAVFNNATRQAHLIENCSTCRALSRVSASRSQQLDLGENVRGGGGHRRPWRMPRAWTFD
jgi:hypothetical protein